MKLEHQHRPFWGFIERHFVLFVIIEAVMSALIVWGYFHIQNMADWLMEHL